MSFLKEPLLHFAVAGAVLFGAYAWLDAEQMADGTAIPVRITKGDVDWLRQTWSRQWLREPSADEMRGLVNELVNEQLLAREAQEMGLAEGDTIIRRRLAQKLKFLVDDTAQFAEPTEQELRAFHAADAARFATAPKLSFEQRYFNPEGREDAEADAAGALAELSAGRENDLTAGDRMLLGDSFLEIDEAAVSSMFGPDFARDAFSLEPGRWQGPVRSGYGLHLLLIQRHAPSEPRPFEDVRETVLAEWISEKQSALNRDYIERLREKYGVELEQEAEAALETFSPPRHADELAPEVVAR